ncbi:MAG TPA: helix-turn-helix domain-containing protein [Terriglobales bacterium]|nr:helix-turn-helix domain-containing protein [Terriglobales bacterium]
MSFDPIARQRDTSLDPSGASRLAPETLNAREIRELRLRSRLTQHELARKLNVSRETIVRWERGRQVPNPVYVELLRAVEREMLELRESSSRLATIDPTTSKAALHGKCPICGKGPLRPLRLQSAERATEQAIHAPGGILAYQCVDNHICFVMAKDVAKG